MGAIMGAASHHGIFGLPTSIRTRKTCMGMHLSSTLAYDKQHSMRARVCICVSLCTYARLQGLSQPLTLHHCMLPDDNLLFSAHQSVRSGPSRIDSRIGSRIDSRIGSRIGSRIASRINSTASHGSVTRLKAGSILAGPAGAQKSLLEAPRLGSWASGASPALAAPQLEDDCEDERSSADGVRISVPEAAEGEQ